MAKKAMANDKAAMKLIMTNVKMCNSNIINIVYMAMILKYNVLCSNINIISNRRKEIISVASKK